jgi:hypothetical protein
LYLWLFTFGSVFDKAFKYVVKIVSFI